MDIRKELEEMNQGVDKALDEFAKVKEKGILRELFEILHNPETDKLVEQWIDMTVILSIRNGHTTLRSPHDTNDQAMIVDGQNGIRDLILKGFVYGLYWKTKELDDSNLEKMWNVKDK